MRTSKEIFQKSAAFAGYQKILSSPEFELALHAALGAFVETLPVHLADPGKSWDVACKLSGARQFAEMLSTLHEPETTPKPQKPPSLKYDDGKPTRP